MKTLDKTASDVSFKVFTLSHSDATTVATAINDLFTKLYGQPNTAVANREWVAGSLAVARLGGFGGGGRGPGGRGGPDVPDPQGQDDQQPRARAGPRLLSKCR